MGLSPEQLADRRTGLGSSDIAAVAEQDPHRAAIDVWLDKLGLVGGGSSAATWIGDRLEQAVADLYAERMGGVVLGRSKTFHHPRCTFALATPDRLVEDGPADVVEIKMVGAHMMGGWGSNGSTDVPIDKLLQVQWQMEVLDVERIDIAALLGGTDFRVYPIRRDREMGADLLELGRWFWEEHVLARVPPPHDGEAAKRLAALRWSKSSGAMLPATPEAEELRDRIKRVKRMAARVGDLQERLEARAMELVGEAEGVEGCFTWKTDAAGSTSWKAVAVALATGLREAAPEEERPVVEALLEELITKNTGAPARRFLLKEPKATKGARR